MITTITKDGQVTIVDSIGETANNITYVVTHQINHIDENGDSNMVVDTQTRFNYPEAIYNRESAFSHANFLLMDAEIDGKLFEGHLDSYPEAMLKEMRNVNLLSVTIECIDDKTGERLMISEGNFDDPPEEDFLADNVRELSWYQKYGYDTDGRIIKEEYDGMEFEILDYQMC